MKSACRRGIALAWLFIGALSVVALAAPSFTDKDLAKESLNPTDSVIVQEIEVAGDASRVVTLTSVTVQNLGTAGTGDIEMVEILDGGKVLGQTTNIAGLASGVTVNLGGHRIAEGSTQTLKVRVTVGTNVTDGTTVRMRVRFYYKMGIFAYTSPWITDLSGETIRDGGFDETVDNAPTSGAFNPGDKGVVQIAVFTDKDANGNDVFWGVQTGSEKIVSVENLGTATTDDIDKIWVTLRVDGVNYTTGEKSWNPGSAMDFTHGDFPGLGAAVPDDHAVTVKVEMKLKGAANIHDWNTIQTKLTLYIREGEQGYEQSVTSGAAQTIRKQGFETIVENSTPPPSGAASSEKPVAQVIVIADNDVNDNKVKALGIEITNLGTADGSELHQIQVKSGTTILCTKTYQNEQALFGNFKTGMRIDFDVGKEVDDDGELTLTIYYEPGTPVTGHTLKPQVRVFAKEPPEGTEYPSSKVTYPVEITLYQPGFEIVDNVSPPEGGTAYSGQRVLAQTIRVVDKDENEDDVTVHPVVVKNRGTARENPDVVKIEVMRRDSEDADPLLMGETTTLTGFRTSGVTIPTQQNNIVNDKPGGATTYIDIYVTIADPEQIVSGRTLQLETRILHEERSVGYDKAAVGNLWTLAINHRPVPNFTFAAVANGTASATPKADFTHDQVVQFSGTATDPDGDAIIAWHWDFGDGNTSNAQNPTHQYPNGGTFDVTLTVTDARGVTGSVTKTIEVEGPPNQPPTIEEITADPENPAEGEDVEFTATITDPDQPEGTAFTYAWDFGDETTSTQASPTHSYDDEGVFTVTLTVTDAQGATDTATIDLSVGNDPPEIGELAADPAEPSTGDAVTFTVTGTTDPDDDDITEYRWNFGDGTEDVTTEDNFVTHIYTTPATYTVTVRAVDARGGISEEGTLDLTVAGPVRVIVYAFPNPAAVAATITYFLPEGATDPVLRIYNLVRELIFEAELVEGETTYNWDLRSTGGRALPNGLYFCVVTATNDAGRAVSSEIFRLLIAR